MKLDEHSMRLIAVGASVAANCHECLETNLACAKECGADADEISQAIWVGKMIRKGAASKMDELIARLVQTNLIPSINSNCACES
jgi:alkylhydroperoxidase/carboxymuconolactone decarboxylase family protein YurZ